MKKSNKGFSTLAIHSEAIEPGWPGDPVVCGISLSTTFRQPAPGKPSKYEYSRSSNPTREAFEKTLAALENGKHALCYASGSAAEMAVLHLLKAEDEIICMDDVYGGTNRLLNKVFSPFQLTTKMVDLVALENLKTAITDKTKLVWVETVTNPTLKVVDIKGVKRVIEQTGREILLLVDNTFLSPYFQQPLDLGADVVLHSVTKYINGHSDVVMGCVVVNEQKLFEKLQYGQNAIGAIPSPFDCYLALRGVKTLAIRMEQHQKNAIKIANHFKDHPKIKKLIYPNLDTHPQHKLFVSQCSGFSGMIAMKLKGGKNATTTFLQNLKIFSLAESLGGYESLVEHPASMTHAAVPPEERKKLGIGDNLVRFSVGLEDAADLIQDIEQALESI